MHTFSNQTDANGKVTVYTPQGDAVLAWPVDARELIQFHQYSPNRKRRAVVPAVVVDPVVEGESDEDEIGIPDNEDVDLFLNEPINPPTTKSRSRKP